MLLSFTATAALLAGCKVTADDVEHWKGTVKGPGKIVAVLLAPKYPMELRTHAALALVEMDRQDVDGVAELQRALQRLDAETRNQVIDGITPGLVRQMHGASTQTSGAAPSQGPTSSQVRAKDAAFLLISQSTPATKAALTNAVVGWFVEDFATRSLSGSYSAEQVVRALGAPAAAVLVNALAARMNREALVKTSELIGQLGDAATKARAATRLVEIETEIEGDAFKTWLQTTMTADPRFRTLPPERIAEAVEINREGYLSGTESNPMCVIAAMKFLADQPPVAARLMQIALAPSSGNARLETRRTRALQALEGKATVAQLQPLLDIALDASNPLALRDNAFDRIGDLRSQDSLVRLWPVVGTTGDTNVTLIRGRVGELVLAIGGAPVANDFFNHLPLAPDTAFPQRELAAYAGRLAQLTPPPTDAVRPRLSSPKWWERVIAIRYFERKGVASDIAALEALRTDTAAVKGEGWDEGETVGRIAERSIAALRERLNPAAAPAPGAPPAPGAAPAPAGAAPAASSP